MRTIVYNESNILADDGLFFGKGVFETILWRDKPIYLDEHLERLKKAMRIINLSSLEENELRKYLSELNIKNKALKITVTSLNILITERELSYGKEEYLRGMTLTVSKVRRNSTSRLCYIKSTCYIENLIEKEEANRSGFDDVIFLNENGNVTETSSANIFIVRDQKIFTPKIEDGLLGGIIRAKIINNFDVVEKSINLEELKRADEVIITNSLIGAMNIRKIDDRNYENKKFAEILSSKLRD